MEEELPEILIKYIPNLEKAINIFSKEALYYYFNEFFDNESKSQDIVDDYVDDYLLNKPKGLENIYRLNDDIEYQEKVNENYMKMYKNNFKNKEELLKSLFNNPFNFEASFIDNFINVIHTDHRLKIGTIIPLYVREEKPLQLYKTSLNESLYSKLHQIPEEINNISLNFEDNDFDYVDDMMRRYGKNIENMTDEEYNNIPKLTDKKVKVVKSEILAVDDIVFWDDDINTVIELLNNVENYEEDEIIKILNNLSEKKLDLPQQTNMFNNIIDLYNSISDNNIDIDDVYINANNYLKQIEIDRLLNIFIALKQNKDAEIIKIKTICNTIDKVFKNEYKFSQELIEIIDNEDESNVNDNYIEYANVLIPNIETKQIQDDDNNLFEKIFKKELGEGLNIDLDHMLKYMKNFKETEKLASCLFYLYVTLQTNFYTNNYNDFDLNKECIDIFYEFAEPIKIIENKVIFTKTKSIYMYIICCFKNISNNEYFTSDKDIEKQLSKLIINNPSCKDKLDELKALYDEIKTTIVETDIKFYTNLVAQLINAKDDVKYINFVNALKYIVPKRLKKINTFISGCCPQLLNQEYEAYKDITQKDDEWFKAIQEYRNNNTISYDNEWDVKNYLPEEVEINEIKTFENVMNDEDDNIDNYNIKIDDDEINQYLSNQSLLNTYVETNVTLFMANVSTKTEIFFLKNYILEKCKIVQNLKHLLLAGCLKDSTYYYDQIAILENSCCNDYNFKIKRSNMYVYLAAKYLTNFNSAKNNEIYEKIKALSSKVVLSREEYNKSISNYREKLKVEAINILENLTSEDKEVAIMLKKTGIISKYDDYDTNNDDTNNDPVFIYKGDDDNDKPLNN
jgi:hypothetical protein